MNSHPRVGEFMHGHLVPISGGKSYVLSRDRVYLGRRKGVDVAAKLNAETARCRLRFDAGWWYADDLEEAEQVRINGQPHVTFRIEPNDEVAVGRNRFRLVYTPANSEAADLEAVAAAVLMDEPRDAGAETRFDAPIDRADPVRRRRSASASAEDLLGRLVPLGGGQDFPLMKVRVTVGRKSSCDVVLPFKTVSSMHCGLEFIDGRWQVMDLGSRNGVRVDGVQCQKAWIDPRSRLAIADHRFQLEYAPPEGLFSAGPVDLDAERPLMEKVNASGAVWDDLFARQDAVEQEEVKKERYNLLDDI